MTKPDGVEGGRIIEQGHLPNVRRDCGARTIVLATGCFDLVHKGHLHFLREAARQGDVLVVGVNSDQSVRSLKGPGRPIVPATDRCAVLAEFACVDYVFTYNELCAGVSIALLAPNVFAVGEDSIGGYPTELEAAHAANARLHVIAKMASTSTTRMIESIQRRA